jgi:hypothetical protein
MKISNLVNTMVPVKPVVAPPRAAGREIARPLATAANGTPGESPQAVPSFITTASLVTISGGTSAVTLLWQVAKLLFGKPAGSPFVAFGLSLLIGTVIYLLSVQDDKVHLTTREKVIGGFIGFLNSMVLFEAAVGILGHP